MRCQKKFPVTLSNMKIMCLERKSLKTPFLGTKENTEWRSLTGQGFCCLHEAEAGYGMYQWKGSLPRPHEALGLMTHTHTKRDREREKLVHALIHSNWEELLILRNRLIPAK